MYSTFYSKINKKLKKSDGVFHQRKIPEPVNLLTGWIFFKNIVLALTTIMIGIVKVLSAVLLIVVFVRASTAQIHCGAISIIPNTGETVMLTFDSFNQYLSGITLNGIAKIQISVEDKVIPDAACKWFLTMEIDNNPSAGTPASEWEDLHTYGSGASPKPSINKFEIRVRNACKTSPIDGVFQTFTNHGDVLDIIANLLPLTAAGSCTTNVNGPGDYLTNYNEYTFLIDIRVKPTFAFAPGIYQLKTNFHLEEQP